MAPKLGARSGLDSRVGLNLRSQRPAIGEGGTLESKRGPTNAHSDLPPMTPTGKGLVAKKRQPTKRAAAATTTTTDTSYQGATAGATPSSLKDNHGRSYAPKGLDLRSKPSDYVAKPKPQALKSEKTELRQRAEQAESALHHATADVTQERDAARGEASEAQHALACTKEALEQQREAYARVDQLRHALADSHKELETELMQAFHAAEDSFEVQLTDAAKLSQDLAPIAGDAAAAVTRAAAAAGGEL